MKWKILGGTTLWLLISILGCGVSLSQPPFAVTSSAFSSGAVIPAEYACTGDNRSPALSWEGAPSNTAAFALIAEDPDAPGGIFIHWVVFDLPGSEKSLAAGISRSGTISSGGRQGVNSFGRIGYDGPCPPRGQVHHYHFRLLALDAPIGAHLSGQTNAAAVEAAAAGHILATAEMIGTFNR
ncbi:MAG TPA: YbhB/YbcL family Raf kinase inhibitor-like protein [Candidatus Binataceae bacterium]|nr:YbhB/YbcL family Raf kinase inhibitor-like protein [Candidatus Binataceae bacterium]